MIPLRLDEILAAVDARWSAGRVRPADVVVQGVSTDSREVTPGSLFVGISGPRFDGAAFSTTATEAGAVAVLAGDEPGVRERFAKLCVEHDVVVATCADPVDALARVSALVRERLANVRVIGITGSCGKTSTKDVLGALLRSSTRTVQSPASFNNHIGVPRTLLAAETSTESLVVEIGTNQPGDIAPLAALARPHVAIVTMVGRSHLEGLGSVEGVAREKGDLVAAVDPALVDRPAVVLNRDCPRTPLLMERVREGVRVITTSAAGDPSASLVARDIAIVPEGTRFTVDGPALPPGQRGRTVCIPLLGEHAVANVLAAVGGVIASGADVAAALDAVRDIVAAPHRLERRSLGGVVVIDDAYNANPESMKAALDVLGRIRLTAAGERRPRRILAVGEMGELGLSSNVLHREAGEWARRCGIDRVVAVGEVARRSPLAALLEGFRGPGTSTDHADTIDEATRVLLDGADRLEPGDVLLVKASRAAGLDRLVDRLADALDAPHAEVAP